jgi:5-formyltetrahydrofolate cyclo-ligase
MNYMQTSKCLYHLDVSIDERPLHVQVRERIRDVVLASPAGKRTLIAAEPELAAWVGVSRGTVRKAIDSLVAEGLLVREQGRGTFVEPGVHIRRIIANRLAEVARPDSRHGDDFESFVPDFVGSERCADVIAKLPAYANATTIFVSRDNNLQAFRQRALEDGKRLLIPSHALRTGLRVIESVPAGLERFAAMLDGLEEFARTISIEQVEDVGPVPLVVTGAVAVSRDGIMFGAKHDYFRVELAILAGMNVLSDDALTIAVVHDCQVIEIAPDEAPPQSLVLDLVVTPTESFRGAPSKALKSPPQRADLFGDATEHGRRSASVMNANKLSFSDERSGRRAGH